MVPLTQSPLVSLDLSQSLWDQIFTVAPLVVIGTHDPHEGHDLAPKHMAMPLGWGRHFCFVCTPSHRTYQNIRNFGDFTVSFPKPSQVVLTSLAAAPRCGDDSKPALQALPVIPAIAVEGVCLQEAWLMLECKCDRILDGFEGNSLIIGQIVAARAEASSLRQQDRDDQDLLAQSPLLAYLSPGRYACIEQSYSFPFHEGFQR